MHGKGNNIYTCIYVPIWLILHYIDNDMIMQNLSLKYVHIYNIDHGHVFFYKHIKGSVLSYIEKSSKGYYTIFYLIYWVKVKDLNVATLLRYLLTVLSWSTCEKNGTLYFLGRAFVVAIFMFHRYCVISASEIWRLRKYYVAIVYPDTPWVLIYVTSDFKNDIELKKSDNDSSVFKK